MVKSDVMSKKMLSILVLYYFVLRIFLRPLKEYSKAVQSDVSAWVLPFVFSNAFFMVIFWGMTIYFYSDIPFIDKTTYFFLCRMKKVDWGIIQLVRIFLSAVVLVTTLFLVCIMLLIPFLEFTGDWGSVIRTLSLTNVTENFTFLFDIPYFILSHYVGWKAMIILYFLCVLSIAFIGFLMFLVSLIGSRTVAFLAAGAFSVLPVMAENMSVKFPRIYYITIPSWVQLTKIRTSYNFDYPSLQYVFIVLIVTIILFGGLSLVVIREENFLDKTMKGLR